MEKVDQTLNIITNTPMPSERELRVLLENRKMQTPALLSLNEIRFSQEDLLAFGDTSGVDMNESNLDLLMLDNLLKTPRDTPVKEFPKLVSTVRAKKE